MPKDKPGSIDKFVGSRLKQEREDQKRSLSDVANRSGTTLQMLAQYEGGQARIYMSRLEMIAKALNRPIASFLPEKWRKS